MDFIDLKAQYKELKDKIDKNIHNVLDNSSYIMGKEVKELEEKLAEFVGVKYCATCANGTDALQIALMCLGVKEGDAVFVPDLTFFSTAEVVSLIGATPIFVDCDERTFNMNPMKLSKAIADVKSKTNLVPKAIMAVDLYGLPADFTEIRKIADENNLFLVEDGAQGFGGSINGKRACSFGDISTTSFFPAKPLGCYGDGGAIFTDNKDYYDMAVSIRVHGKGTEKYDNVRVGLNSRLDTIQAAVLLVKLEAFASYELDSRQKIAKMYTERLGKDFVTPLIKDGFYSSYAQYTLIFESNEKREFIKKYLEEKGIPTMVYYPKPMHLQRVYSDYNFNVEDLKTTEMLSKCVLSLPMHPYLDEEQIDMISRVVLESLEAYKNG